MAKLPTETSVAALSAALAAAPPVEKDEFADAFAGFTAETPVAPEPAAVVAEGTEGAEGGEGEGTEIEGAPGAAEGEETPEQIAAKAAEDAAAAAEAAKTKKAPADDAVTRLADMLAERTKPQPQVVQQTRTEPAPLYSPAEVTKLTEFYKEWPEVAQATEVLLKGAMTNITNHIFAEVAKTLAPRMRLLEQLADGFQYNEIKGSVPDYNDEMHNAITAWIDGQKPYLKAAYTNVMQEGTVDDFNDLVSRYRQETGTAAPAPTPGIAPQARTPAAPRSPATTETLSPAAKKAAAALAPVNSKRTGVVEVEPQGFDDAFDKYAALEKAG